MGTFDNAFDPDHHLSNECPCGVHASRAEHEREEQHRLQCVATGSQEERYGGVVAAALMRGIFPRDAARRAFLTSVGASTALAALAQFFPLKTATELFAQGAGAIEKKDLKVG